MNTTHTRRKYVDAPMLDIPTAGVTEPRMRIPQPPGWEPSTELDNVHEVIRFAMVNTDLGASDQNAVGVTLVPTPDADAQTLLDDGRAALVTMLDERDLPTDLTTTARAVCGLVSSCSED